MTLLKFVRTPYLLTAFAGAMITCLAHSAQDTQPSSAAVPPPDGRPNVVVIALDDVGFSDLGCFGSEIRTPHIDRLARSGLRYTRFDTKAICSPTRASLMTGRNSHTVRMADLPSRLQQADRGDLSCYRGELPDNAQTLAQALRRSGYATFALGKWHLIPAYETGEAGRNASFPLQRGFDHFYGFKEGWTDQYHPELFEGNARIPTPAHANYHLSEDLVDRAIGAMKASRTAAPNKPMFLYLAFGVAHAPMQVDRKYIDRYDSVYVKGWDAIRSERFARMKEMGIIPESTVLPERNQGDPSWSSLSDQQRRVYARFMATYAGFIEHGDAQIGRLMTFLQQSGLMSNTMVVLFSDNGAASEMKFGAFRTPYADETTLDEIDRHLDELGTDKTQALYQRPWAMAGVTPFRRYKLWPYLGGVRAPLIVTHPGIVKDEGAVRTHYVDVVDIAPTILEAAGTRFEDVVEGEQQIPVAGKSFLETLVSAQAPSPRTVQYFELRGNRAITSGNWRALAVHRPGTEFSEDEWRLFNVESDPSESRNLATVHPEKLEELKALWWTEAEKHGALPLEEPSPLILKYSGFSAEFEEGR